MLETYVGQREIVGHTNGPNVGNWAHVEQCQIASSVDLVGVKISKVFSPSR